MKKVIKLMIKSANITAILKKVNGIVKNSRLSNKPESPEEQLIELNEAVDELLESYSMAQDTIRSLSQQLRKNNLHAIMALVEALNAKDPYTRGHSERVSIYSLLLSEHMNLTDEEIDSIYIASYLHDIGKIGIHENVLNKPDKLTNDEYEHIKSHPGISGQIVSQLPNLEHIASIVRHHHERHDGHGYPDGLKGLDIPLGARILAIADAFDAMTTDRPYRDGFNAMEALSEIDRCSGLQFDPELTPIFIDAYGKSYGDRLPVIEAS
ncbi:MAG: HD-GYP domain-containing protein [Rubrobacteridae bacterium]|nr:HD-GYP domain-containing protein [Rubrobacteridae bacterium]